MLRVAVIGCGRRVSGIVKVMQQVDPQVTLAAVADPDVATVKKVLEHTDVPFDSTRFFTDVDELLKHADDYDGVLIGTRCHLHAPMAVKVAPTRLPLLLEKPVAIDRQQLEQLAAAFAGYEDRVVVSFPLRATPLFKAVMSIIDSGRLGTINQVQAVNNVAYGGVYYGQWYRNYNHTGGLWLQKTTHDFDYLNLIAKANPMRIAAMRSQKVYGGDMPHDLRCTQCDKAQTCDESHLAQAARGDSGGMATYNAKGDWDHWCAFSKEIKNQDAGSAIVMYDNGVHLSYTQNFVTRRSAGRRGAIVTGHRATVVFNWCDETIRVTDHFDDRVDDITVKASDGHCGGDHVLVRNFINIMRGNETSKATLKDGLLSVAMCLAARQSCQTQMFEKIEMPTNCAVS